MPLSFAAFPLELLVLVLMALVLLAGTLGSAPETGCCCCCASLRCLPSFSWKALASLGGSDQLVHN